MSATVFTSIFAGGGGTSRYGDFVIVRMQNASFIVTPMEMMQLTNWARARMTSGTPQRDRTSFIDRFEVIIGRIGSAISTRGSRPVLARLVKSMKANGLVIGEWNIPHDINDSVEIKKKPPVAPAGSAGKKQAVS